jgi:hypothetical protein
MKRGGWVINLYVWTRKVMGGIGGQDWMRGQGQGLRDVQGGAGMTGTVSQAVFWH